MTAPPREPAPAPMSGSPPTVLVIEDEPQMRRFLRPALEGQGYRVLEASTASEAMIQASSHNPDLVVLDYKMTGMDGMAVMKALRAKPETRLLPVLMLTAMTDEPSTRAGFELINLLTGFTHALIIDCLELPHPLPGRIRRLELSSLSGSARLVGVHDISVADAFELASTLGTGMPGTVEIYAVEGEDMQTLSEEMTPAIAAAVPPLARALHARIVAPQPPSAQETHQYGGADYHNI